jgi:hypothetical protein
MGGRRHRGRIRPVGGTEEAGSRRVSMPLAALPVLSRPRPRRSTPQEPIPLESRASHASHVRSSSHSYSPGPAPSSTPSRYAPLPLYAVDEARRGGSVASEPAYSRLRSELARKRSGSEEPVEGLGRGGGVVNALRGTLPGR